MRFSMWPVLGLCLALLPCAGRADDGQASYLKRCAPCHQADGQGVVGHFPPLTGMSGWLASEAGRAYVTRIVMQGYAGPIRVQGQPYQGLMLTYRGRMKDEEFVSILRYVAETLNTPAHGYRPIDLPLVAAARAASVTMDDDETADLREALPER
ncbi:c-type cytochrome [Solimonas soli]|uniref:c-type cytochrome n=1 Tax=Solimonas soli TaxID=413479 RepID=UPI0004AFAC44|nr:cytochrome c [Solimonas soli]